MRSGVFLRGGAAGLCFGGIGLGACGDTKQQQSTNIVNTAVAQAYYKSAFSCKSNIQAGNSTVAQGVCSADDLGMDGVTYAKYKANVAAMQAQLCSDALKKDALDQGIIACMCNIQGGGGGCNININQSSLMTSQSICQNQNDVQNKLAADFSSDVTNNIKSFSSDLGGLMNSNNQNSITDLANNIRNSISTENIAEISNTIQASNKVKAGCGGINFGITQYSQFQNILQVLNSNSAINDTIAKLANVVKTTLDQKNMGFLGFLYSPWGIIIMVVIGIIVVVALFYGYKKYMATTDVLKTRTDLKSVTEVTGGGKILGILGRNDRDERLDRESEREQKRLDREAKRARLAAQAFKESSSAEGQ